MDEDEVQIGEMNVVCKNCKALKFKSEEPGLCCRNGKVELPQFKKLPEPLYSFIFGKDREAKEFKSFTRKYNSVFQMSALGVKEQKLAGFNPTFRIKVKSVT